LESLARIGRPQTGRMPQMFDDTDPTHLSQDNGDGDRPDASGDREAGQQGDFRTLAPGEGGNPPDDEK
jgi:hypothetical protein